MSCSTVARACLLLSGWFGLGGTVQSAEPGRLPVILALGDSITKGVRGGVTAEETFSAVLAAELKSRGQTVTVINRGIGGERTDGDWMRTLAPVVKVFFSPGGTTVIFGIAPSTGTSEPIASVIVRVSAS